MTRTYEVTLARGEDRFTYRVSVDVELAARERAIVDARVRAAGDYHLSPAEFALWSIQSTSTGE